MDDIGQKRNPPLVLIVDDDRTILMAIEARVAQQGYTSITATSGAKACEIIEEMHDKIDAILLDRMMPGMDGIKVANWLAKQTNLTKPPIIMITGSDSPKEIKEGIDAGVFYYLTKPVQADLLKSVILSAIKESQQQRSLNTELKRHKTSFMLMDRARFHIRTLDEAENISCFVANCFPNSDKLLPAIAELLINAIEHGNLQISYEEKTELIASSRWREELNKRANQPEYKNKTAEIIFSKENDVYSLQVSDQGNGFAWKKFLQINPSRALDNHGRGVARANMVFSKLQYNKEGNKVLAIIDNSIKETLDW